MMPNAIKDLSMSFLWPIDFEMEWQTHGPTNGIRVKVMGSSRECHCEGKIVGVTTIWLFTTTLKTGYTWRDVETHKRFECVFLITNWFWGGMAQVTVQQLVIISHECKVVRWKVYWKNIYGLPHIKNPYINNMCV